MSILRQSMSFSPLHPTGINTSTGTSTRLRTDLPYQFLSGLWRSSDPKRVTSSLHQKLLAQSSPHLAVILTRGLPSQLALGAASSLQTCLMTRAPIEPDHHLWVCTTSLAGVLQGQALAIKIWTSSSQSVWWHISWATGHNITTPWLRHFFVFTSLLH